MIKKQAKLRFYNICGLIVTLSNNRTPTRATLSSQNPRTADCRNLNTAIFCLDKGCSFGDVRLDLENDLLTHIGAEGFMYGEVRAIYCDRDGCLSAPAERPGADDGLTLAGYIYAPPDSVDEYSGSVGEQLSEQVQRYGAYLRGEVYTAEFTCGSGNPFSVTEPCYAPLSAMRSSWEETVGNIQDQMRNQSNDAVEQEAEYDAEIGDDD